MVQLTSITSNTPLQRIHMNKSFPFQVIDWSVIPKEEHEGEHGTSFWQVLQLPGLRLRMVEYSAGYLADHWCRKGHIVHCIKGSFASDLESGESFNLTEGMTYVVSDE